MRFLQLQWWGGDCQGAMWKSWNSVLPMGKGAQTWQLSRICTAGHHGVCQQWQQQRTMQSCNSLPPLPPLPGIRIPGTKGQSHFFPPWIAFWDSGRLPLRLPKPCCCLDKLLALCSINHPLSGNCSSAGTRHCSKISSACFLSPC